MGTAVSPENDDEGWLLSKPGRHQAQEKTQEKPEAFLTERYPIYGGAAEVVRTRQSGDVWHFRMRISSEGKYFRQSLKTRNLDIAEARADALFIDIKAKIQSGKKIFSPTVQQVVDEFLKHRWEVDVARKAITEGRWKTIQSQLKHFVKYAGIVGGSQNSNIVRLGDFDKKSFYGYQSYRQNKNAKDPTIRNEQATINALCHWAFEEGLHSTPKFHFPSISNKGVDPDVLRRSTYSDDEYWRICRALITYTSKKEAKKANLDEEELFNRQLVRHYFLLGANTMMRSGELIQLKWGNVETYSVGRQRLAKISVLAETSKVRQGRIIAVRGGKHFDRLKSLSRHTSAYDFVFANHTGNVISPEVRYRHYARLMELAEIKRWKDRKLTYYSTRHYGITKRLQNGADPLMLSKACGTSLKHLTETYFHANLKDHERAALVHYSDSSKGVVELD